MGDWGGGWLRGGGWQKSNPGAQVGPGMASTLKAREKAIREGTSAPEDNGENLQRFAREGPGDNLNLIVNYIPHAISDEGLKVRNRGGSEVAGTRAISHPSYCP